MSEEKPDLEAVRALPKDRKPQARHKGGAPGHYEPPEEREEPER